MSKKHVSDVDESWFAPNAISNALENLTSLAATYTAKREKFAASAKHEIDDLQKQPFDSPDSNQQVESARQSLGRCSQSIAAARKRLADIEAEIAEIDARLAKLAREQLAIESERRAIEATIAKECGPLGLPPFWIFRWPNPEWVTENHRLSTTEQKLQEQHRSLQEHRAAKNHDETGWHQKRNETVQRLEAATKELARLESDNREQLQHFREAIRIRVGDFRLQRDRSLEAFDQEFLSNWSGSEELLRQACVQAREQQPRLDRLLCDQLTIRKSVPRFLCIARKKLQFNEWQMSVPVCLPFPFPRTLVCDASSVSAQSIAVRTLLSCPLGQLSLVIIDPRGMGKVVQDLLPLLDDRSPIEHGKVLTLSDEIESALASEFRRMEDIIQRRLTNRYENIGAFNSQFPDSPIAHRLIIYADFPEQATDRAIGFLERLQELGPKAGISVILTLSDAQSTQTNDRRLERSRQLCDENADRISHLLAHDRNAPLTTAQVVSDWTLGDPSNLISAFGTKWREWCTCRGDLMSFMQESPWTATARDDLRIPIGWSESGKVSVEFGQDAAPHALVGGRSGSGKSNLIHVLISSACHRYSPDHLRIGLLDFKQGVEFARYANGLPHAEVVSVETDRMLGVQVLEDYKTIMEDRAKQFAQHGVRDYSAWCESHGTIPRHLVIVDEFQILFESEDALAMRAATALARLAKQGRAFGVHLMLATQTLSGITNHVKSLAGNLGLRIALACTQEDSNLLLDHRNSAASKLKSPPEAILNTQFGDPSHNRIVSLPHASDEILDVVKEQQTRLAQQHGFAIHPHVHFSSRLADFPREMNIEHRMLIGERLGLGGLQTIPIEQILSKHVLFVSQDADARLGTLLAIAASLRQSGRFKSIVTLSSGSEGTLLADHVHCCFTSASELVSHLGNCAKPVLAFLGPLETIDELAPASFGKKSGEEAGCRAELEEYLLNSQNSEVVVVAWSSNWRAISRTIDVRKFLKAFDFRMASGLSADDCFALFERRHEAISATRGLAIDVSTDQLFPFKPFRLAAN